MALGKLNGVLDTNIGKALSLSSENIGKVGGGSLVLSDSYTKLLLHMDGSNGSTTFTDEKGKTFSIGSGSPIISTAQGKFNQSAYFNGSSYITTPYSKDFNFGAGDFTIDFWVYFTSLNANGTYVISQMSGDWSACTNNGFLVAAWSDGSFSCWAGKGSSASYLNTTSGKLSINTWKHIALVRNETSLKAYAGGDEVASLDVGSSTYTSNSPLRIGGRAYNSEPTNEWMNGYVDEVRISKGIARWTAAFTPPTSPYSI